MNIEMFLTAKEVEESLERRETATCLAWCHDNKSRLRKMKVSRVAEGRGLGPAVGRRGRQRRLWGGWAGHSYLLAWELWGDCLLAGSLESVTYGTLWGLVTLQCWGWLLPILDESSKRCSCQH